MGRFNSNNNFQMNKQQSKKVIKYKDLPFHLQRKYKNSIIFDKEDHDQSEKFEFNIKKLKQRKAQKQKTIEEKLQQFKINSTEEKYLFKVFQNLSTSHNGKYFTETEIKQVLKKMDVRLTKAEMQRMIWQFDEDLNKKITEKQFVNMYKKCTIDKNAAESKNLFHLTQFLMYCKPDCYRITVEDTLELLFVRSKIEVQKHTQKPQEKQIIKKLQHQIDIIFEGEEKTPDGLQKEITFDEYLQRINKRAIQKRRREIQKAKSVLKYGSSCFDQDDD